MDTDTITQTSYDIDVSFACRRLTQAHGRTFWGYAEHFAALPGKHKDGDQTAYRWKLSMTGPRLAAVIGSVLSLVRELSEDENAEILHLELTKTGDADA